MTFLTDYGAAVRRTFVLSVAALTFFAAPGLAGVLVEAQAATEDECFNALDWDDTSATQVNNCEWETITPSGTDSCLYEAYCPDGVAAVGDWPLSSLTVLVSDGGNVLNCNGVLATSCD